MKIIEAGAEAADLLAHMHGACFAPAQAWDAAAMRRLLASPGVFALIASEGEKGEGEAPAGFVMARRAADEGEILTICVLPHMRRKGAGRRLLGAALAGLGMEGARRIFLEVAADNAPALALYEGAGFARAGLRRGYYATAKGRTDAVLMAYIFGEGCGCEA